MMLPKLKNTVRFSETIDRSGVELREEGAEDAEPAIGEEEDAEFFWLRRGDDKDDEDDDSETDDDG